MLGQYHTFGRASYGAKLSLVAERRRLPVLQSPKEPDAKREGDGGGEDISIEERPPWHWVGFGAVAIFATWLPGAFAAQKIGEHIIKSRFGGSEAEVAQHLFDLPRDQLLLLFLPLALLHLAALALGSTAGGYLVGRFGSGTTIREPALAGGVVAFMAVMLTVGRGGVASALTTGVVILLVAVGFAALGGKKGLKKKERSAPVAGA